MITNSQIQARQNQKFRLKGKNHKFLSSMHKLGMRLIYIHVTVQNMIRPI